MDDATMGGLIAAGLTVFFGAWWLLDRARHPKFRCSTCRGDGRIYSQWSDRWRDCHRCSGGVRDRHAT